MKSDQWHLITSPLLPVRRISRSPDMLSTIVLASCIRVRVWVHVVIFCVNLQLTTEESSVYLRVTIRGACLYSSMYSLVCSRRSAAVHRTKHSENSLKYSLVHFRKECLCCPEQLSSTVNVLAYLVIRMVHRCRLPAADSRQSVMILKSVAERRLQIKGSAGQP